MNSDDSQPLDNDARGALAEVGLQAFADRVRTRSGLPSRP